VVGIILGLTDDIMLSHFASRRTPISSDPVRLASHNERGKIVLTSCFYKIKSPKLGELKNMKQGGLWRAYKNPQAHPLSFFGLSNRGGFP